MTGLSTPEDRRKGERDISVPYRGNKRTLLTRAKVS